MERSEEWGIPVVNHLWVEECFKRWAYIDPAADAGRYVSYPHGVNYAEVLGQRGIGNVRTDLVVPEPNVQSRDSAEAVRNPSTMNADFDLAPKESTSAVEQYTQRVAVPPPSGTGSASEFEVEGAIVADVRSLGHDHDDNDGLMPMDLDIEFDGMDPDNSRILPAPGLSTTPRQKQNTRREPNSSASSPLSPIPLSGALTIDVESPSPKSARRNVNSTSAKGKGKAVPVTIELSDDDSDAEMPSAAELWMGTQAKRPESPPPRPPQPPQSPFKSTRPREDTSDEEQPRLKRPKVRRRIVDHLEDDDTDEAPPVAGPSRTSIKANTSNSRISFKPDASEPVTKKIDVMHLSSSSKEPIDGETASASNHPDNVWESLARAINTSSEKARAKRLSDPNPPSSGKSASSVKAYASFNDPSSSKQSPSAPIAGRATGGRMKRQAATKAAVSLAANIQDMNVFQADLARNKGDPRKMKLGPQRGGGTDSEFSAPVTSTDASTRASSKTVRMLSVFMISRLIHYFLQQSILLQGSSNAELDAESTPEVEVRPVKRRTRFVRRLFQRMDIFFGRLLSKISRQYKCECTSTGPEEAQTKSFAHKMWLQSWRSYLRGE